MLPGHSDTPGTTRIIIGMLVSSLSRDGTLTLGSFFELDLLKK